MKIAVFSTRSYDREFLARAAQKREPFRSSHSLEFIDVHLRPETLRLAEGYDAICVFVNDQVDRAALKSLAAGGVRLVVLRCAGYNNVDLTAVKELGITIARVSAYSSEAVADHTVALTLALNRKIYRAYRQVREGNFAHTRRIARLSDRMYPTIRSTRSCLPTYKSRRKTSVPNPLP